MATDTTEKPFARPLISQSEETGSRSLGLALIVIATAQLISQVARSGTRRRGRLRSGDDR